MSSKTFARGFVAAAPVVAVGAAMVLAGARPAVAQDQAAERRERCATRVAVALTGESASAELLAAADPQAAADTLLADARFATRFATFVNARFNDDPGETADQDSAYWLARHVITTGKGWKDLFVGPYRVVRAGGTGGDPVTGEVQDDANGLGYFRSRPWLLRYAGNEPAGIKIATAYRIMQNTIGLDLTAVTNAADVDISAEGRKASACAGCHYQPWFALDKVAAVLTRRVGTGDNVTFQPPTGGPQDILGGVSVADDKGLVTTLVNSPSFDVQTCNLAFRFLYGREANKCEGELFDACVDAFRADGRIQSALSTLVKDASFCQ